MGQGGVKKQNRNNPIFFLLCSRCRSRRWWWKERKGGGRGKRRDQGLVKVSVHAQSAFRTIHDDDHKLLKKTKTLCTPRILTLTTTTTSWTPSLDHQNKSIDIVFLIQLGPQHRHHYLLTLYHFINDVLRHTTIFHYLIYPISMYASLLLLLSITAHF